MPSYVPRRNVESKGLVQTLINGEEDTMVEL